MPKDTPSMAKNKIKRSLRAILDPHPSKAEIESLWLYFDSTCAYCGETIERASRNGHVDHLVPSAEGGNNEIHNHALSCSTCNGDEKREESWLSFLVKKAESDSLLAERRTRIEMWLSRSASTQLSQQTQEQANAIVDQAVTDFERAVNKMRALRQSGF